MASNPFDQFDTVSESSGNPFDQFDDKPAPEKSSILRRVGDYGISALKGAIAVPEAAVGLADIVTGGHAGKAAEEVGFRPREAKEILDTYLSPEQQAANKEVADAKGFLPTLGAAVKSPSVIAHTVVESIPSMLGGGVIARGISKLVPKIAPYVAGAVGEGAVGAGSAAENVRQQADDGLLGVQEIAPVVASGIGTAAFGAAGGRVAQTLGIADVDTMLAQGGAGATQKGIARRIIEGGIAEGVFEELPQSVQEQIWQNVALDKPLLEGVEESAAMGLLAGGVMGGVASGAFTNKQGKTQPAVPPAEQAQPDQPALGLPNYPNEPLISFPDGSAGTQRQAEEYINALPEDQRIQARAALYGYAPEAAAKIQEEVNKNPALLLPNARNETLVGFPDGSIGTRAQAEEYINGLPESERMVKRAALLGYAPQPATPAGPLARAAQKAIGIALPAKPEEESNASVQTDAAGLAAGAGEPGADNGTGSDGNSLLLPSDAGLRGLGANAETLAPSSERNLPAGTGVRGVDAVAPFLSDEEQRAQAKADFDQEQAALRDSGMGHIVRQNGRRETVPTAAIEHRKLNAQLDDKSAKSLTPRQQLDIIEQKDATADDLAKAGWSNDQIAANSLNMTVPQFKEQVKAGIYRNDYGLDVDRLDAARKAPVAKTSSDKAGNVKPFAKTEQTANASTQSAPSEVTQQGRWADTTTGKQVAIGRHKAGSNFLDPAADAGAFIYEQRSGVDDKKPLQMVLNKDGKLVVKGAVLNADETSNGTAWVPSNEDVASTVERLLKQRADTALGSAERKAIDAQIAEVVKQDQSTDLNVEPQALQQIIEVKDRYGRTHRVRQSDLDGAADRLPTIRKNGDVVSGEEIPRSILASKPNQEPKPAPQSAPIADEGLRPIVESIAKRRAVAEGQLGKNKAYGRVLAAAKDMMNGQPVKLGRLRIDVNELKGDKELHAAGKRLIEIASAPAKQATESRAQTAESYRKRIDDAKSKDELNALASEIQKDESLTDQQAQDLDDAVFERVDRFSEPAKKAAVSQPFDSESFDKARENRIKESKESGNTHLDQVPAYVETMRGKAIYYVHDQKVRGVIRTVDNRGNVYVDWSDKYSADKELASPSQEKRGKKSVTVYRTSLGTGDLKDYVFVTQESADDSRKADIEIARSNRAKAMIADRMKLSPSTDTIFEAMAKLGGLKKDDAVSEFGLDPADLAKYRSGILFSFTNGKRALTPDGMREALAQYGYDVGDTVAEFGDKLDNAIRGIQQERTQEDAIAEKIQAFEESKQEYADAYDALSDRDQETVDQIVDAAIAAIGDAQVSAIMAEVATENPGESVNTAFFRTQLKERINDHIAAQEAREQVGADAEAEAGATAEDRGGESDVSPDVRQEASADLLGDNTATQQSIADAARAKDTKRNSGESNPDDFTLTGSDRAADQAVARGARNLFDQPADEVSKAKEALDAAGVTGTDKLNTIAQVRDGKLTAEEVAEAHGAKIEDLGEKIGGARKDTATKGGTKVAKTKTGDERPTWAKRYEINQIAAAMDVNQVGKWAIYDSRDKNRLGMPRQMGGSNNFYDTREAAEAELPELAVSQKHKVYATAQRPDGTYGYEIYRNVTDRKRVKIVDRVFDSRVAALEYMGENAADILETNTTFGEIDLPTPDDVNRIGVERRTGDVADTDFIGTFGFRGVEFGNWNNQIERQQFMNAAYDGLLDLADVLNLPPKALSLNGDLALAFGARGQGLTSAKAHYEREKSVINLTKENGAGSLAHEFFHAMDHYFGRQDGKASAEWKMDADGTRSFTAGKTPDSDYVSAGFSYKSNVRPELKEAYKKLMETIFRKAATYVEDTQQADKFVAAAKDRLAESLDKLRAELSQQKDPKYWKRKNAPASAEQLAEFDTIAEQLLNGQGLDAEYRGVEVKSRSRFGNMRRTNDALEKLSALYKDVRGRSGFDSTNQSGVMDGLRQTMANYSMRLKTLSDAQAGQEKVKTVPTDFLMNARELDEGRGKDYWTTPHEMAARAFQGYVEDKIAEKGGRSPFMNYGREGAGILTPWGVKFPFPRGDERKAINSALDKFVSEIQTKETEQGVALFSRGAAPDRATADSTETEAFKRWFGDSKVVDAEGKPLVVYHGTGAKFDTFVKSDGGTFGDGIYLTSSKEAAQEYADTIGRDSTVMELYVSIKNPAPEDILGRARHPNCAAWGTTG